MVIHQLAWKESLSSVIYQLSVIGTDLSNIGSLNVEHNLTKTFVCVKKLHDDYVIHFLAFGLIIAI